MKFASLLLLIFILLPSTSFGQGNTSGAIEGKVTELDNQPLANAAIVAIHLPSGTRYGAVSRSDGRFTILNMRVGGPYSITTSMLGYAPKSFDQITVALGNTIELDFTLLEISYQLSEGVVLGKTDPLLNSDKTGSSTSMSNGLLQVLPTINRTISDFVRLTPQFKNSSFVGQDIHLNNITVDGSSFNNSFGLSGQPGERTGVAPISIDALEQVQVNVAPYDVKQANFVGAAINMVTKSGTNEYKGSVYFQTRNESFIGTKAADAKFNPGIFNFKMKGANIAGPIIQDKLFYFLSLEAEDYTRPATSFVANDGSQNAGGNYTRVLKSDLDGLRNFLGKNFGYETGGYDNYNFNTSAKRLIAKFDYNLNIKNKISLSYTHLDSKSDQLIANHNVLGFGYRRGSINALNFQNSNFAIKENIRSMIAEWNADIRNNITNNMIISYRYHDESRESAEKIFPFVDILKDGITYTSFGTEPFTPYSSLTYSTFQFQNNLNFLLKDHTLLLGFNIEKYESKDCFFPGSQSVYVYNSLEDFYTDAKDYLANPNRVTSPVNLRRFQYRYSNIPGQDIPYQPLKVLYSGIYVQDKWDVSTNFRLTIGLRFDTPFFYDTGYRNVQVEGLNFKDETGKTIKYSTKKLPDPRPLFSPRLGFNWKVFGTNLLFVRGGSGIFTGQPAYVWISNQIGNNGILTGYQRLDGSGDAPLNIRPFNPKPDTYKPSKITGEPAATYELALTDPDYKFPQIWRTNIAVDHKLPFNIAGTLEFIYDKDINGIKYINANLSDPSSTFSGADNRVRWTSGNRINANIDNATVLKNQHVGYAWNIAATLEKSLDKRFFGKIGYSYGQSKNTVDPGSVASGSWGYNAISGNPNNPGLSFSANSPDHRFFSAFSYKLNYFNFGSTNLSLFFEAFTNGRSYYVYSDDLNGDGCTNNDLIYIPRDKSEMYFNQYTSGTKTYTVQAQQEAWEKYIQQDKYLQKHRGNYCERNGVMLPTIKRLDLGLNQEFYGKIFGKRNGLILRFDIFNFTNFLNKNWGIGQMLQTNFPLVLQKTGSDGKPSYILREINGELIAKSFIKTANLADVYRMQLTIKWMFN